MKYLPGCREVDRALKNTVREVKSAQKQINQHAAKLLARGNYAGAESVVAIARKVAEFQKQVDDCRVLWRGLGKSEPNTKTEDLKTPLWKYYRPILHALVEIGGSASRHDIENYLQSHPDNSLPQSDFASSGSRPRWKVMVQRGLRAMLKESFVVRNGKLWKITSAGITAAQSMSLEGSAELANKI
jgi:hypothetical protein